MALYVINIAGPTSDLSEIATGLGSNIVVEAGEGYFSPWGPKEGSSEADYPSEDDVRDGTSFGLGLYTGNMTEPAQSDVRSGVQYGTNGTEFTGTLTSSGGGSFVFG